MKMYRVFRVSPNGRIWEPPQVFYCQTDDEALSIAQAMTSVSSVEIWEGARFIVSLPRDG